MNRNIEPAFREIIDRAALTLTDRRRKLGRYAIDAPEGSACWHVLTIQPQHENTAAGHLVGRGFGIYLPTLRMLDRKTRKPKDIPMFGGYLFVFVWDFWKHYRRIMGCPGVMGPLMVGDNVGVLRDEVIHKIEAQEGGMITAPRKRKRRWRREPDTASNGNLQDSIRIITYSALSDLKSLDDEGRVGALRKALGLSAL